MRDGRGDKGEALKGRARAANAEKVSARTQRRRKGNGGLCQKPRRAVVLASLQIHKMRRFARYKAH